MNRYLVIKIGGSNVMVGLMTKALSHLVYFGDEDEDGEFYPKTTNQGTMIMLNFMSDASIDEITFALKDIAVANFFVTEINDETFRANLSDKLDAGMQLNKYKSTSGKTLDDMNDAELQIELNYALEKQLFERAAEIRDKMKAIR